MPASLQHYAYHGSAAPVPVIHPRRFAVDGELLCTTLSVNVARRYGPVVSRFRINNVRTKTLTVREWMSNSIPLQQLRQEGYSAVRVKGDRDCFDFPVDMVVVLDATALTFDKVLDPAEIVELVDEFSDTHEPEGPSAPGWLEWSADHGDHVLSG